MSDPVIYVLDLASDGESLAYYVNQRGALAARLAAATGLIAEQRAEGLALVDPDGDLTDIRMPAEGTEAHVTLMVAELLATRAREPAPPNDLPLTLADIAAHIDTARRTFGKFWRKSALEAGAQTELAAIAVTNLECLHLVVRIGEHISPLPAIARFALGDVAIDAPPQRPPRAPQAGALLFEAT